LKTPETHTEEQIYDWAVYKYKYYGEVCPKCSTPDELAPYGSYYRYLVSYKNGFVVATLLKVSRFKCSSCGSTHALLPDILIPYSSYSLLFKLTVLVAYFERKQTVGAICEKFGIAVSTLYAWKKQLMEHKDLLLGLLVSHTTTGISFLNSLLQSADLSGTLKSFFHRFNFSFLQSPSQSRPP
jgi:transposase-like protein